MPSVTLEVSALVIVLVERDAQPVVVEVDRPVQVLDFEEDFFDTNESHGLPPPSVQNGDLLELLHRLMPRSFWVAHFEPRPSVISTSAQSADLRVNELRGIAARGENHCGQQVIA